MILSHKAASKCLRNKLQHHLYKADSWNAYITLWIHMNFRILSIIPSSYTPRNKIGVLLFLNAKNRTTLQNQINEVEHNIPE